MTKEFIKIGLVSISDRASSGVYEDKGIPSLLEWLARALITPIEFETRLIADEQDEIEATLKDLVDSQGCHLILTTGGTGPAIRDVTPEATLAVADKTMPGFGEQMRQISLNFVPTAILSRQVAVIRKQCLIINLPGQPKAIAQTLEGLKAVSYTHLDVYKRQTVQYDIELDVRHEDSPVPTIRTKETLDTMASGDILKVITGKESTVKNLRTLVANNPFELLSCTSVAENFIFLIKKL